MKLNSTGIKIAALAAVLVVPGLAMSQNISVVINGEPVVFQGVGPRQINGRVMVPLRGIMEKLGAYIGFESATRTVSASKSGIDLSLHLGDRHALLNGKDVMLDVPAQEIGGSTMVPLRFVGEALGADVKWSAETYTVNITTDSNTTNQNDLNGYTPPRIDPPSTPPAPVSIRSFDLNRKGTVRGGEELRLTLMGTPGGDATFSIPGVIQDVQMSETQRGVYEGSFRVPVGSPINISQANAIARLRVGANERIIQSDTVLGFDNQAPMITTVTPDSGTRVTRDRPSITATLDDGSGSGVDPATIELRFDNRDVTSNTQVTGTLVTYHPDQPLSNGSHEVTVNARDRAGNSVTKTWSFRVANNTQTDRTLKFDGNGQELLPGTEVTFSLVGEPGGQATFSVGDRVRDRKMREVEPGHYSGAYTIRRNDDFANSPVTAKLTTADGDTIHYEGQGRLTLRGGALEAPSFSQPLDGSTVGNRITLRGSAAPGSRVRIKIDYSKTTLRIFQTNGNLGEFDVIADDRGQWETQPIDMGTGLGDGPTTYKITALSLGVNGKQSAVARLTLKH